MALRGDSFTTSAARYTYFAVTDARRSVVFGPGVLSGCAPFVPAEFFIEARDSAGNRRVSGGDAF
ncbi:MAG: hypothetical protein ACK4ZJ_18630, partial [Allorhizobium sp.]